MCFRDILYILLYLLFFNTINQLGRQDGQLLGIILVSTVQTLYQENTKMTSSLVNTIMGHTALQPLNTGPLSKESIASTHALQALSRAL